MKKIKSFLFSEKKLSGAIFGILILVAFAFIFGPNIYAQFALQNGGTGNGYGYGYGYGYGANDGSYRLDGATDLSQYGYGYGFADTYTWAQGGFGSCNVSCGSGTATQTVTCHNSVGATVDNSNCHATEPATTQSCNVSCGGGGGGGGSYNAPTCTDVVYGDYAATCFAGYQYRSATSRTPVDCVMTVAQQETAKKVCGTISVTTGGITVDANGNITGSSDNSASFIALEKSLVKKINQALSKRLSGRILLQVQGHGESWYVNPMDLLKYFMGRPADAFAMMRKFGLGVSEKDYTAFAKGKVPANLSGRILLRVKAHGEAYYVNPLDHKMYYMGRPADAFALMRKFGLGITNSDLRQIGVGELK